MAERDTKVLAFNLVNVLDWRDCTKETEHGVLPTSEFLRQLIELIEDECDTRLRLFREENPFG